VQFTQPPVGGAFGPVTITFTQTGPTTINKFAFDDEIITNQTGVNWLGFRSTLAGGASPVFDTVATGASGGGPPIGFKIAPFTTASFGGANTILDIGGGTVLNNSTWFPGSAPGGGGKLWVNVTPSGPGGSVTWTLTEVPIVPEPAALGLFSLTVPALRRRR
jgi:hypothetical protein